MSDCISRKDAKNYVIGRYDDQLGFITMEDIIDQLDYVPAADVRPVVRGKWEERKTFFHNSIVKCSLCGNFLDLAGVNAGRGDANFCPNCGADMRPEPPKEET